MEHKINQNMSVGEIVAKFPQTRMLLEKMGIDFCCGGKHDLQTAAKEKGVELESLVSALEYEINKPAGQGEPERDWTNASLTGLCDHIEARHHTYMKENLPRISEMLARVKRAHGVTHGTMLVELDDVFVGLRDEIESHLMKEERILFPYIRQIEAYANSSGEMPEVHCGTVANPINQMEHEHDNAGQALAAMRKLTGNYNVPPDGCNTFKALYEAMDQMEKDLHEHIHLENNILFPKAVELEAATGMCR